MMMQHPSLVWHSLKCVVSLASLHVQVLQHSWEKDEAMAWTAVMALLTHAAAAVYEAAENLLRLEMLSSALAQTASLRKKGI